MAYTDEQIAAFPAWLQKLVKLSPQAREAAGYADEDIESAAKSYHLDKDYTKKSQRAAEMDRLQEQFPQYTTEQIVQLADWYSKNQERVTQLWNNRDKLVERQVAEPVKETPAGQRRKWRDFEYADPYDADRARTQTASLREAFEDLHADASQTGYQRWKDEYQKTEIPRLDQVANGLTGTVLDLMDFALEDAVAAARDPKHQRLSPNELLKASAARGERDFRKVATAVREERMATLKPVEDSAYQRGLEEGKKSQEGPSGPLGGARPGWRPETTDTKPKNRDELFQRVVSAVEQKSGRPVPL